MLIFNLLGWRLSPSIGQLLLRAESSSRTVLLSCTLPSTWGECSVRLHVAAEVALPLWPQDLWEGKACRQTEHGHWTHRSQGSVTVGLGEGQGRTHLVTAGWVGVPETAPDMGLRSPALSPQQRGSKS